MYAENTSYEVHACFQGQWKTLGEFADANEAVAEAVRLRRSRRYVGIRVTEAFHDAVNKFADRVIYRYTAERRAAPPTISETSVIAASSLGQTASLDAGPQRQEIQSAAWIRAQGLPVKLSVAIAAAILALVTLGRRLRLGRHRSPTHVA